MRSTVPNNDKICSRPQRRAYCLLCHPDRSAVSPLTVSLLSVTVISHPTSNNHVHHSRVFAHSGKRDQSVPILAASKPHVSMRIDRRNCGYKELILRDLGGAQRTSLHWRGWRRLLSPRRRRWRRGFLAGERQVVVRPGRCAGQNTTLAAIRRAGW